MIDLRRHLSGKILADDLVVIDVKEGSDIDDSELAFSWEVTDFTERRMEIQIDFEKPVAVSTQGARDEI